MALAEGSLQNERLSGARIFSYDLFLTEPYFKDYLSTEDGDVTGSLLPEFLELVQPYADRVAPCAGDLLSLRWRRNPIAVLFVDIAKSWELMSHVFKNFFPCLEVGALVVHQDYVWHAEWWIHVYMSWLHEYFEPVEYAFGATCVFRYTKKIPDELFEVDPATWGQDRWLVAMRENIPRHPEFTHKCFKMGIAEMLASSGSKQEALDVVAEIEAIPLIEAPAWHNFEQTPHYNLQPQKERFEAL